MPLVIHSDLLLVSIVYLELYDYLFWSGLPAVQSRGE